MDVVQLKYFDDVYMSVVADNSIIYELSDYFTFSVPGAQFTPQYKAKFWDGKIRLLNIQTRLIYRGLVDYFKQFCKERGYELEVDPIFSSREFSAKEASEYITKLNLTLQPRDYQVEAFIHAVRENRALLLSPTASGKSLIIYLLQRYYNAKTLIIVPTTTLVHQLESDFRNYGGTTTPSKGMGRGAEDIHKIYSGQEKHSNSRVVITTWQSIYQQPKQWFQQFECVIGDEVHLFKAKSLTTIMQKLVKCRYKFGFTGTLDGTQTNKLVIEGLFGSCYKVTTTAELIEKKQLADFKIKCIVLQYSDAIRKQNKNLSYQEEIDYLCDNQSRNRFIRNLALSLKGNTLVLFSRVEQHGKVLYNDVLAKADNRKVFFVHGGVDGEERNDIRQIVENETDSIIVASFGTFSTGINIKNLHNIIFASPSKSRVRNLQSIGRGLRKSDTKEAATLFDIADDMKHNNRKNYTLLHFEERIKIYNEEKFEYKIYTVQLAH